MEMEDLAWQRNGGKGMGLGRGRRQPATDEARVSELLRAPEPHDGEFSVPRRPGHAFIPPVDHPAADPGAVRTPLGARTPPGFTTPPPPPPPPIPDHELLRLIGRGSYGQVWLARNRLGTLRAVKIVSRETFEDRKPFEREFKGIQRFEPVSRAHEGVVDILQVGGTDEYFYYVMELADPVRKSEIRSSKSEGSPKPEVRRRQGGPNSEHRKPCDADGIRVSDFGLLSDFGLRNSNFYSLARYARAAALRPVARGGMRAHRAIAGVGARPPAPAQPRAPGRQAVEHHLRRRGAQPCACPGKATQRMGHRRFASAAFRSLIMRTMSWKRA